LGFPKEDLGPSPKERALEQIPKWTLKPKGGETRLRGGFQRGGAKTFLKGATFVKTGGAFFWGGGEKLGKPLPGKFGVSFDQEKSFFFLSTNRGGGPTSPAGEKTPLRETAGA